MKLEQSIREVHELFLELSGLVSQQGELVNSIAYNVELADDKVEQGTEQLKDAERHQGAGRRKKLICSLILFVVIVVIVLLVILSKLDAPNPDPASGNPPTLPTITT